GQLRAWLASRLPDAHDVQISELSAPAFTGFSNETLLFDASWTEAGTPREESLVARIRPTQHSIFLAHNFDVQYRVMQALAAATDIPLPRMFWLETEDAALGSPFYVMAKVDGQVPGDNPPYTTEGWLFDADSD